MFLGSSTAATNLKGSEHFLDFLQFLAERFWGTVVSGGWVAHFENDSAFDVSFADRNFDLRVSCFGFGVRRRRVKL